MKTRMLCAALVGLLAATPAHAVSPSQAPGALAAPGAPIRALIAGGDVVMNAPGVGTIVVPAQFNTASCSQGPSGTLRTRDGGTYSIMVTAAHCVTDIEEGDDLLEPVTYVNTRSGGLQRIGEPDRVGKIDVDINQPFVPYLLQFIDSTDWATVRLDDGVPMSRTTQSVDHYGNKKSRPVALTGVRDYRLLGRNQVSFDNAGQPICKDGHRTARSCGVQLARTNNSIYSWGLSYKQGDSGGINYDPRTRKAIGVTSMGLGPLGRTQPIDRAIETGYGIPSGQVNQHFTLAPSTQPHADFKTFADEDADLNAVLEEQGVEPVEYVDPQVEWAVASSQAQGAAAKTAQNLSSTIQSNPTPQAWDQAVGEAQQAWDYHSERLWDTGMEKVIDDLFG